MRALLQRVSSASVSVAGVELASIGTGLLVCVAVLRGDDSAAAARLAERIVHYRLFPDRSGRMARDVCAVGGALLVVPQFSLGADTRRGRRPDFASCAPPEEARGLCDELLRCLASAGAPVASGRFAADMQLASVNDGPVSVFLDTGELR